MNTFKLTLSKREYGAVHNSCEVDMNSVAMTAIGTCGYVSDVKNGEFARIFGMQPLR